MLGVPWLVVMVTTSPSPAAVTLYTMSFTAVEKELVKVEALDPMYTLYFFVDTPHEVYAPEYDVYPPVPAAETVNPFWVMS